MSFKLLKLIIGVCAFSIILSSCSKNNRDTGLKQNVAKDLKKSCVFPDSLNKISFSGFSWSVVDKPELESFDEINVFKKECVFVDSIGNLHLNLKKIGDVWYGAELICDSVMEYGDFAFVFNSPISKIDSNVVLFLSAINSKQYVVKGLTETGIRYNYGNDPDSKSNIEYFMYSTSRKFAGVKRNFTNPADLSTTSSCIIGITPENIYYKVFKGISFDDSNLLNSFNVTPKNRLTANSEIDELIFAKPYYKLRAKIGLAFYDISEKYPSKDIEVVISKFAYFPQKHLDIVKK